MKQEKSFRPLARLGWFPTHFKHLKAISVIQFPAPREGWVGSYPTFPTNLSLNEDSFPAPREAWVGSYVVTKISMNVQSCSFRPLSRLGEFPTKFSNT